MTFNYEKIRITSLKPIPDPKESIPETSDTNTESYSDGLNTDQFRAYQDLKVFLSLSGGGFYLVSGRAGSGKTFLTGRIIRYIQKEVKLPVAITAPTHKAVGVLSSFIDQGDTYTTHAFLGMREDIDRNGKQIFVPVKFGHIPCENYRIVIVDEASMVPDIIFDTLEELVTEQGYKVIFVGDSKQIPPVNFPDSLPFMKDTQKDLNFGMSELNEIVRQAQDNPIIEVASEVRDRIYSPNPLVRYDNRTKDLIGVTFIPGATLTDALPDILDMYGSSTYEESADHIKIIAWRNKIVDNYNLIVRKHIFGDVPKMVPGDKLVSDAPIKDGKIILAPNNTDLLVEKIDISSIVIAGIELAYYRCTSTAFIRGNPKIMVKIIHEDSEKDFNQLLEQQSLLAQGYPKGSQQSKGAWRDFYNLKEKFHAVKHAYAITAHKSQGSTYDHAVVDMRDISINPNVEERNRILYTAFTRPKYSLRIIH